MPRYGIKTHIPVLLKEVIKVMQGKKRIIDGTFGCGGHSRGLLDDDLGRHVFAIDRDPEAISIAKRFENSRLQAIQGQFGSVLPRMDSFKPDGILLDLGASSLQVSA